MLRVGLTTTPARGLPLAARHRALVATLAITGFRLGEAVAITIGSPDGPPGEPRLSVVSKGDKARVVPVYPVLESVLAAYLSSRASRFPLTMEPNSRPCARSSSRRRRPRLPSPSGS